MLTFFCLCNIISLIISIITLFTAIFAFKRIIKRLKILPRGLRLVVLKWKGAESDKCRKTWCFDGPYHVSRISRDSPIPCLRIRRGFGIQLNRADSDLVKMQIFEQKIAIFRRKTFYNQLKLPPFFEAIKKPRGIHV